jgi:ribosomal protein L29
MSDQLKDSTLLRALSDAVGDLVDLFQKEIRLAKAELADRISQKARGGVWLLISGGIGFLAAMVLVEAAVFAIASYGIAPQWSCLIVAGALLAFSATAYGKGRAEAKVELTPTHTLHQVRRDVAMAKEQLS